MEKDTLQIIRILLCIIVTQLPEAMPQRIFSTNSNGGLIYIIPKGRIPKEILTDQGMSFMLCNVRN